MYKLLPLKASMVALQLAFATPAAALTLLGDDIDMRIDLNDVTVQNSTGGGTAGTLFEAENVLVVDPGLEADSGIGWLIDVDGDSILVSLDAAVQPPTAPPATGVLPVPGLPVPGPRFLSLIFSFTDLDPRDAAGNPVAGARLSGATLSTNLADIPGSTTPPIVPGLPPTVTPSRPAAAVLYGDHGVMLTLDDGADLLVDAFMRIDLSFQSPTAAPLPGPSTPALMVLAGLAPLLARRRHRHSSGAKSPLAA